MSFSIQTLTSITAASASGTAGSEFIYTGGDTTFHIYGTWNSATVTIEASLATSGQFTQLKDSSGAALSFDNDSIFKIDIGKCKMRFVATGSGGNPSLTVKAS